MNDLFSYFEGPLDAFITEALNTKDALIKRVIAKVTEGLVDDLKDIGIIIDTTYKHTLDNSAIRHALKSHGSAKEVLRGQVPITDADFKIIPYIVAHYDSIATEKNRRGQDVIIYTKTLYGGVTVYVEEIRLGRHELAASTLYKRKKENSPTQID